MKNNPKNIILIGYKASGKSTLGKKLADYLNYQFVDTDTLFFEMYGVYPHIYYEKCGEIKFRDEEKNVLFKMNSSSLNVIATGGGVVENLSNIDHLKTLGKLIYLSVDFNTVKARLAQLGRTPHFVELKHFNQRVKKYLEVCDTKIQFHVDENIEESFTKLIDKLGEFYG